MAVVLPHKVQCGNRRLAEEGNHRQRAARCATRYLSPLPGRTTSPSEATFLPERVHADRARVPAVRGVGNLHVAGTFGFCQRPWSRISFLPIPLGPGTVKGDRWTSLRCVVVGELGWRMSWKVVGELFGAAGICAIRSDRRQRRCGVQQCADKLHLLQEQFPFCTALAFPELRKPAKHRLLRGDFCLWVVDLRLDRSLVQVACRVCFF
jgi:hypothetical protein